MKKDIISKEILKNIARDVARHILKIEIQDDMELIDKEFTRIEKRDADLLFKNGDEIVHIEIQNNNHKKMHQRMLRYYSDIYFEYEERYVIRQYILYIGKERCSIKSKISRDKIDYSYDIIDIITIPCESFLQSSDPSAIVLSILCDFEEYDKQVVVNTILKRLKELSDGDEYKNYLKMINVLSTNRNLEDEVEKGVQMLTVDIEKTPFYKIGIEKGMERGIEKGIQRGIEKGKQETLRLSVKAFASTGFTTEKIAELLHLTKEEVKGYLKEIEYGKVR